MNFEEEFQKWRTEKNMLSLIIGYTVTYPSNNPAISIVGVVNGIGDENGLDIKPIGKKFISGLQESGVHCDFREFPALN